MGWLVFVCLVALGVVIYVLRQEQNSRTTSDARGSHRDDRST